MAGEQATQMGILSRLTRATRAVWSGDVQQIWFNLLAIHRATFVHSQSIIAAMLTILFYLNLKFQIENRRG